VGCVSAGSFFIDLKQLSRMMQHATPRSLLIIDEFGKGTAAFGTCVSSV